MNLTYSELSRRRRAEFETKNYKKFLNYVQYFGNPNNNRNEYHDFEPTILEWISKKIKLKLAPSIHMEKKKGKDREQILPFGVIAIDYLKIFWDFSVYVDELLWFRANVYYNSHQISFTTKKYKIIISDGIETDEIEEYGPVYFTAPIPQLESIISIPEFNSVTTYCFKIEFDNSRYRVENIPDCKTIHYETYKMYIYEKNLLRAVIMPLSKN